MTASIILALLKIVDIIFTFGQQQQWINEGKQQEIAMAQAEILRKSNYAKQALVEAGMLSDSDLDQRLRDLEPK